MHIILDEYKFWPHWTTINIISCLCVSKIPLRPMGTLEYPVFLGCSNPNLLIIAGLDMLNGFDEFLPNRTIDLKFNCS